MLRIVFLILLCAIFFACKAKEKPEELPVKEFDLEQPETSFIEEAKKTTMENTEQRPQEEKQTVPQVSYSVQKPMSLSALSKKLPSFGVNLQEIDPLNYENPDIDVLRQMGAEQYLISFFSGEQFYKENNFDKAIAEYTSSIDKNGEFAQALISRGNSFLKKGEYESAIDDYTRSLKLSNNKAEVYNYRGFAKLEIGEFHQAVEDFSRAIEIKNNYVDAFFNRSHALLEIGDYDKVIEDCDSVIAAEPENAYIWNRRGSAWYLKGDNEKAIEDFSKAIRFKNNYATAFYNRGNAWLNLNEQEKAQADFAVAEELGF